VRETPANRRCHKAIVGLYRGCLCRTTRCPGRRAAGVHLQHITLGRTLNR
jgi:hypothetical protein